MKIYYADRVEFYLLGRILPSDHLVMWLSGELERKLISPNNKYAPGFDSLTMALADRQVVVIAPTFRGSWKLFKCHKIQRDEGELLLWKPISLKKLWLTALLHPLENVISGNNFVCNSFKKM